MLSVVMLNVVMLSVVASNLELDLDVRIDGSQYKGGKILKNVFASTKKRGREYEMK
jgi:uncharacterized protein (DUF2141 family)